MIDEAIGQEDRSRVGFFCQPLDQSIVLVSNFSPVSVVDRKEIDDATRDDQDDEKNRSELSRRRTSAQREAPQAPEAVGDKQIDDDQPDVQKLMIGQDLDAH